VLQHCTDNPVKLAVILLVILQTHISKGHAIKCLLSFASQACDKFQYLNGHMITLSLLMRCMTDTSSNSASATTAASRDLAKVCITFVMCVHCSYTDALLQNYEHMQLCAYHRW
jgi:hypothetical protein